MGRRGGEYGTVSAKEVPKQIPVVAMSMSLSCVAVLHCPRLVQPSIVLEAVRKGECMPPLTVRNRSLRSSAESTPNRCQPPRSNPKPNATTPTTVLLSNQQGRATYTRAFSASSRLQPWTDIHRRLDCSSQSEQLQRMAEADAHQCKADGGHAGCIRITACHHSGRRGNQQGLVRLQMRKVVVRGERQDRERRKDR
jgi:hypothetical protein